MRRGFVAGNWKMNGSLNFVSEILAVLKAGASNNQQTDICVFPPFPYLSQTQQLLQGSAVTYGGQTVSEHQSGAFTGEVSAEMLKDFASQYVIVGHSERRALFHETNEQVAEKFSRALLANIYPVLCVGETQQQRQQGKTWQIIEKQLDAVLTMTDNLPSLEDCIIAYEPVWAIGTGLTATPQQAEEVHLAIREKIASHDAKLAQQIRIIYGGSVKADNAAELFAMNNIDGALVGGASLNGQQFLEIVSKCNNYL